MENKEHTSTKYVSVNYSYLAGVLGAKLKWITLEFERQGLLKSDDREKALGLALKAIADAEESEREYTQRTQR